ncbi:MAG: hypothetical protein ABSE49_00935 [Polyangiaceae bacterium]|jgi:hypothetical protein
MNAPHLIASTLAAFVVITSGGNALAQNVAASGQPYPNRIVNGVNLGYSTRPADLTPLGISLSDCLADTTLQFSVTLSGFTGADNLEVWASTTSDCTAPTDRGIGATTAKCWAIAGANVTAPVINTPQTYSFDVRVQDLVGWQQGAPSPSVCANPPPKGKEACNAQPTWAAVPMNVDFLAIDANGNSDGTPFQYSIITDLVGPPAPSGLNVTPAGNGWLASWTPNGNPDTLGYDLFFAGAAVPEGGTAACSAPPLSNPLGTDIGDAGGGSGITVADAKVGTYSFGPAQSDTQAAVVLTAVDGLGNLGPATSPACDAVGMVDADPSDESKAPGLACAVGEAGAPIGAAGAAPVLGLLALAWGVTRRRAS